MWADGVPNLLIGLREGLEGGLVVSILLAAVRRSGSDRDAGLSTRPIWLGVLAALVLSLGFGAVLTFSRSEMSTRAQEAFGGILSVIAVVLVTVMVFWMRRTARGLSGELNAKVDTAMRLGAGALAATAFLAVGREGLETALFLWTAVQASGSTVAPLLGAALGVAVAVLLCWLLYRRAIRIDLGAFFARTAIALIVIAGGVLAYGLGDLQDSGLLAGVKWVAFDLSGSIAPDAWWVTIVRGVTNLTPTMTWLQAVAYVVYIAVVLAVFLRARNEQGAGAEKDSEAEATGAAGAPATAADDRGRKPVAAAEVFRRHKWVGVGVVVLVPLLVVGGFLLFRSGSSPTSGETVTITADACAPDFTSLQAGARTFTVVNKSGRSGEVLFVRSTDQGAIGELESIGPGTQRTMSVTVPTGSYSWQCQMSGAPVQRSISVRTLGGTNMAGQRMFAVAPLQPSELETPIRQYQTYVAGQLVTFVSQIGALRSTLNAGDLAAARAAWLPAQLTWERVGAAYDSFGDLAGAIDGGPDGLPKGVTDPGFTGMRRIEYGLWHGQPASVLAPYAAKLAQDTATLQQKMPTITAAPTDMTIRVHEILEDAQRDHLSGMSDQGSGAAFPETLADVDGTRVVLGELASLVNERKPGLVDTIGTELDTLQQALLATRHNGVWDTLLTAPIAERQRVNAAVGQVLENLSQVPDLLEIGAS